MAEERHEAPKGVVRRPFKGLIRPFKGLIRPFRGLIRPFKGLIRPFRALKEPYKALFPFFYVFQKALLEQASR